MPKNLSEKSPEERRAAAGRGAAHAPLATPAPEPVKPAAEAPLAAETQETAPAEQPPAAEPVAEPRTETAETQSVAEPAEPVAGPETQ